MTCPNFHVRLYPISFPLPLSHLLLLFLLPHLQYTELQQSKQQLPNMEFGRRMAVEKEIDRNNGMEYANVVFDETGHFLLYATMLGIKIVNLTTNRVATMLGKMENAR